MPDTLRTELVDQTEKLNYTRLYNMTLLTKRIVDILLAKMGDDTLTQVKDKDSLYMFQENIEEIIANRLKNKYNL